MVSYLNQPRSLKQSSLRVGGDLALYPVVCPVMCAFQVAFLEVDAL